MKFMIMLKTSRKRYCLFGAIVEFGVPDFQYGPEDYFRDTVAFIRPQKLNEGMALKLWGYDRSTERVVLP